MYTARPFLVPSVGGWSRALPAPPEVVAVDTQRRADDATLVGRCLDGDREAFAGLVQAYEQTALATAMAYVGNSDDAGDVTQDAFVTAFTSIGDLRNPAQFGSWFRRIVQRHALERVRDAGRSTPLTDEHGATPPPASPDMPQTSFSADVSSAVQQLPMAYRDIVLMYYLNDLSYRGIAEIMDLPESTIRSRLRTARRRLKGVLPRQGRNRGADDHGQIRSAIQKSVGKRHYRDALERLLSAGMEHIRDTLSDEEQELFGRNVETILSHVTGIEDESPCRADWGEAPDVEGFVGRAEELATLRTWIADEQSRLIAVIGMGGIGKTALAARAARIVAGQFECVFWRSLVNGPPLSNVLTELIGHLLGEFSVPRSDRIDEQIRRVMEYLRSHRCLIVLDNVEGILEAGAAGRFREGYEGYGQLIRQFSECPHQSTALLTSRERPRDFALVERVDGTELHAFELKGLDGDAARELPGLESIAASDDDWQTLVEHFSGNPLALRLVAEKVLDLFGGDLSHFLAAGLPLFDDVRDILDRQFERLTPLERDVMCWLAIVREPVTPDEIRVRLVPAVSASELLQIMHSLSLRTLVEHRSGTFLLQNVITEYVTDRIVEQAAGEIAAGLVTLLDTHPLTMATARPNVRDAQRRLILSPVGLRVVNEFGPNAVEEALKATVDSLRAGDALPNGYAAGNYFDLVAHLFGEVVGWDFSHLSVRQADLTSAHVHDTSFAHSVFGECALQHAHGNVDWAEFSPSGREIAISAFGRLETRSFPGLEPLSADCTEGVRSATYTTDGRLLAIRLEHAESWPEAADRYSPRRIDGGTGSRWHNSVMDVASGAALLEYDVQWMNIGCLCPSGRLLAHDDIDFTIKVLNLENKECVATLPSSVGRLSQHGLAFHPDGEMLATCGYDGSVRVWDVRSAECKWTSEQQGCSRIAFTPDGDKLAISDTHSHRTRFMDADCGTCRGTMEAALLSFHPDGRTVAGHDSANRIVICAVDTSDLAATFRSETGMVTAASFSPDGRYLLVAEEPGLLRVWDLETGQSLNSSQGNRHANEPRADIDPTGRLVAVGEEAGQVHVWDVSASRVVTTLREREALLSAHEFTPSASSPSERDWLNIDEEWRVYDEDSELCINTADGSLRRQTHRIASPVRDVVFSPDGSLVSGADPADRGFRAWHVSTGECVGWYNRSHAVRYVCFAPNSSLVACHTTDDEAEYPTTIWNCRTGQLVRGLPCHSWHMAFTPDGRTFAGATYRDGEFVMNLWDVSSGERRLSLEAREWITYFWLYSVTGFSADGRLLGTCLGGPNYRGAIVWDTAVAEPLLKVPGSKYLSFLENDRVLVRGGMEGQTVSVVDVRTGEQMDSWNTSITGPTRAFSSDGRMIVTASEHQPGVSVWNVDDGSHVCTIPRIRPYDGTNIAHADGLTPAETATLKRLGAIEQEVGLSPAEPQSPPRSSPRDPLERRFTAWAGGPRALVSVVCVEAADRTILSDRLEGNQRVERMRARHAQRLRDLTGRHHGLTICDDGASASIAFHTPTEALEFTRECRRETEADGIRLLTGIHVESIRIGSEDPFDHLATHLTGIVEKANSSGVWASDEYKDLLARFGPNGLPEPVWIMHPNCQLKGLPGKHKLWSLTDDAPA